MNRRTKGLLVGVAAAVAAVAFLALTVYPFHYGTVESAVLVGAVALFAVVEIGLDNTDSF